jgi:hypothetical protein
MSHVFKRLLLSSDRSHPILLAIALTSLTCGVVLATAVAQTNLIVAEGELSRFWRSTYDILVRPAGARSPIEEKYGLVEANHLSGISGGITYEQYDAIQSIPGIEVVAPIAMLGYVPGFVGTDDLGQLTEPGAYVVEEALTTNGGTQPDFYRATYYYVGSDTGSQSVEANFPIVNHPIPVSGFFAFSFLIAGIDPFQEAALVGLEQALLEGEYLTHEQVPPIANPYTMLGDDSPNTLTILPSLVNNTNYVQVTLQAALKQLTLPPEVSTLQEIMDHGGNEYLASLPGQTLAIQMLDSREAYRRLIEGITQTSASGSGFGIGSDAFSRPIRLLYQETVLPFTFDGPTLKVVLPNPPSHHERIFNSGYIIRVKGIFNIDGLPEPANVNRVPLETYFPPVAILRYDEQGNPINPPRELRPTLNPIEYVQTPPLLLTTLEAARALRGESAISAIRVRVALDECLPDQPESCTLTDASQRKIEAIAIEIQRQTGLDVEIMVGSSPTRVLVHVPEIGYVEEQWIQKGVNLVYKRGIQTGNWLLMGTLLLAGALFTLDMAWAEVLSRRRAIALQKALGWRSRTVFAQIVRQVVMIGALATLTGTLIALAVIRSLEWESVPLNLLIALPVMVIMLCIIGSLLPAWSASRVPPVAELQRGGVQYQTNKHTNIVSALWSYGWSEIKRRRVRSVLTGMGSALAAGLLTLLLGVTLQQRGMLGGTLLGEFILVNVQGYHYAIVAIGLGLAFLSTFNGLLGSILERRREIGVLKAMGWRTVSVAHLFILQGILLGIVGGLVGAFAGCLVYLYLYRSVSMDLLLAILSGVSLPGLVGALAALYPARLAARIPPAEAVRYE